MRQLAPDVSYHSLVALGIASIQGLPVASFEKDDADRLLFFCSSRGKDNKSNDFFLSSPPTWLRPPAPSKKRSRACQETSPGSHDGPRLPTVAASKIDKVEKGIGVNGIGTPLLPARQRLKAAAMRPIPHVRRPKMTPFSGISEVNGHDGSQVMKANLPPVPPTKLNIVGLTPTTQRKSYSSSSQAKQIISLNPLPLKKHGCGRGPIHSCLEVSYVLLKLLNQFLVVEHVLEDNHIGLFL